MLKLAEKKDIDRLLSLCEGDLLGTRIGCYALAYGFERDFLNIWFDETSETVIAKYYDSVTVSGDCGSADEILQFLSVIGFKSLELTQKNSEKLHINVDVIKKSYVFSGESENLGAENIGEEYFKSLYTLVCDSIPGSFENTKEAYLSFLSDLTFRLRRGLARCRGFVSDSKVASSVITSAETESSALLSAVACDKEHRGKGLGKRTVLSIVDELKSENKKVFVIALNESAESFYEYLGFEFFEKIVTVYET